MRTREERLADKAARPTLKERMAAADEKNAARSAPKQAARAEKARLAQEQRDARAREKAERTQGLRETRQGLVARHQADESAGAPGPKTHFRYLGVLVQDGQVYWTALGMKTVLGPLAGSGCVVTGESSRHTLTRIVTVAGAFTKKSQATAITTAGGQTHCRTVKTTGQVRAMERECARFNALVTVS